MPSYRLIVGPFDDGRHFIGIHDAFIVDDNGGPALLYFPKRNVRDILRILNKAVVENPNVFDPPTQEELDEYNSQYIFDGPQATFIGDDDETPF